MQAHRCQQQGRVGRPLPAHHIVSNNLILGFLNLHQLAELGRLAHFAFADDFRVGSNTLTILPGVSVTPRKTRAVVCRSTWLTSGIIASNSCFIPRSTACCFRFTARFTPLWISSENRWAWFRTCRVKRTNSRYFCCIFSFCSWFLDRLSQAICITRRPIVRRRSRNRVPCSPTRSLICFMIRVSTRVPSPNRLLSVG